MARIILDSPGQLAFAGAAGQTDEVFGTTAGGDIINIGFGPVTLDASFNAGGDLIRLPGYAWHYSVEVVGSRVVLSSAAGTSVSIPLGTAATLLEFRGGDIRNLQIVDDRAAIGGQLLDSGTTLLRPVAAAAIPGQVEGGDGDELLTGDASDNRLSGGGGDDLLLGNAGNDELVGGDGSDTLNGGPGRDRLTGGPGADTFAFEHTQSNATNIDGAIAYDRITDFVDGSDLLYIINAAGGSASADITNVVNGGFATSETLLVDTLEALVGGRYANDADAIAYTVAGVGVGVIVDSNANTILDTDDVFIWIETPGAIITATDFA